MDRKIYSCIWIVLIINTLLGILNLYGIGMHAEFANRGMMMFFLVGLPFLVTLLHGWRLLGFSKLVSFVLISMVISWTAETVGIKFGWVFGIPYTYRPAMFMVGLVPLEVLLFWTTFIYSSYAVVQSWWRWLNVKKSWPVRFATAGLVSWLVVAIDLFVDPLQIADGRWLWLVAGEYFGVPLSNFAGWILVSALIVLSFELVDFLNSQSKKGPPSKTPLFNAFLFLPSLGYGSLMLYFCAEATLKNLTSIIPYGLLGMVPPVIISVFLFLQRPSSSTTSISRRRR